MQRLELIHEDILFGSEGLATLAQLYLPHQPHPSHLFQHLLLLEALLLLEFIGLQAAHKVAVTALDRIRQVL